MSVLTRYLLRAHLGPMLFAFFALTGVILINTIAKEMANLAGKGLPLALVGEFFLLSLPANIALTLPMSVLVAVLYTFSTMASENEIMALKASGIDLRRVVAPVLLVAAVIAGSMIWFNDRVLPESNYRWRMLMVDVAQTTPLLAIREQAINPIQASNGLSHYYLQAGQVDAASSRLGDVTIYDVSNQEINRTIYADSGYMAFNEARTDLVLTLYDGHINEVDFGDPNAFQQMQFDQQILRMAGVSQQLERSTESAYRTDRDMTVGMMKARVDSLRAQLGTTRGLEADELPPSAGSAADFEMRTDRIEYQIREYQFEIQKKYSIAVATLIFVLIGVPLALRLSRGGVGMVIAVSLAVFAVYYVGLIGGETLADEGYVHPAASAWLMNGIFGALGVAGLLAIGREQSTSRGAGWGELPAWLRFRRRRQRTAHEPVEASR
jgi:lipopolysaccharide export system permease protein